MESLEKVNTKLNCVHMDYLLHYCVAKHIKLENRKQYAYLRKKIFNDGKKKKRTRLYSTVYQFKNTLNS